MRSLGKVDCRSLGNQKLVLQATAEDGTAADVRMDAEGHIAGNIFAPRRKRLGGQFKLSTVLDGEPTAEQIRLVGGVSIRAFAANPRTFRGFEGHVILDEGGVMPFFDRIWAAAAPIITRTPGAPQGYTVSVIGTPCGDGRDGRLPGMGGPASRGQKVQIAVGLPGVPTELRYPEPPTVDVTMLRSAYEMPTPAEVYGRWAQESPPSSKRGARAAHGRKPWQGGGWRASAARR